MVHWPSYNEWLVRRSEVMLDFDVIDGWKDELEKINEGKVGEPYHYPESFIQMLGVHASLFPSTVQTDGRRNQGACKKEGTLDP